MGMHTPPSDSLDRFPRRDFLRLGLAAGLAPRASSLADDDRPDARLLIRGERPLNAETPVSVFDRPITPTECFFIRSHFRPPAVSLQTWLLRVEGLVERPFQMSLADAEAFGFEIASVTAVLQCAGNGRAYFEPIIPGVPWRKGAVGCAEWSGVRLAELLARARVKPGAAHVHVMGADAPPHPKTPPYLRSIPLDRASHESSLLATQMNGDVMPALHGGPQRLIVPGWTGNHWMKWVRKLVVSDQEAPGFYQQTGYRIPREPAPPGTSIPPDQLVPVAEMNVKSLFARPEDGATIPPGRRELVGVAWSGMTPVERVEVSIDEGPWMAVRLDLAVSPFAWRLWRLDWDATPGQHVLAVRATDASGATQPDASPWNKSGYLWNGIDRIRVEVKG
jgi:DMSO/TMAO reductase YedYZ molybdopterin-dependent catalytic subunit